jgi:hypothetical protein
MMIEVVPTSPKANWIASAVKNEPKRVKDVSEFSNPATVSTEVEASVVLSSGGNVFVIVSERSWSLKSVPPTLKVTAFPRNVTVAINLFYSVSSVIVLSYLRDAFVVLFSLAIAPIAKLLRGSTPAMIRSSSVTIWPGVNALRRDETTT